MATFKSGKQRRAEIIELRSKRQKKIERLVDQSNKNVFAFYAGRVPVSVHSLKPNNSYGVPDFVLNGYYEDKVFSCKDCGEKGVWTAGRQKWWYEIMKGDVFTTARRCKSCRAKERLRRIEARRISEEGMLRKQQKMKS